MYNYLEDTDNNIDSDIENGWILTDADTGQRALELDKDNGVWVIRQTNPNNAQEFLEDEVYTKDIEEVIINELLQAFGYDQDIREDEAFPQLLAEMHFEMFSL